MVAPDAVAGRAMLHRVGRRPRGQAGLTLVEVIVSLGLTMAILTVALTMAQSIAQVHGEQSQIQSVQENLRGGLAQLSRDARLAGTGFAAGTAVNAVSGSPAAVPAIVVQNSNPDTLDLLTVPGTALATTLAAVAPTDSQILVEPTGGVLFATGELALLTDYATAVLYQVGARWPISLSGISGLGIGVGVAPSFPVASYAAGSLLLRAASVRYGVQVGGTDLPGTSLLVVQDGAPLGGATTTSPVAEGVYDLEVAVGIDGINGQAMDGALREVGAATNDDEWVFNVPGEALPVGGFVVRALRLSVVGRTSSPGSALGPGRPAVEDRPAGAPDRYRWRVMTETVTIRNAVMR